MPPPGTATRPSLDPGCSDLPAAYRIARLAVRSLHAELVLYPKPGLVSLCDNGAHADMNAETFMRSLFSLRRYFVEIAAAGMRCAPMSELRVLGLAAESRMLEATGQINTHRGAIFALGLLAAAAGLVSSLGYVRSDATLREMIAQRWRRDLLAVLAPSTSAPSHGQQVAARYRTSGARGEAIDGFPAVFDVALPALRFATYAGAGPRRAQVHAFFALLARVDDTNVLYRGGPEAATRLKAGAADFLAAGSVFAADWERRAESLHRWSSGQRLSPGGCADLLAAAVFVDSWQAGET